MKKIKALLLTAAIMLALTSPVFCAQPEESAYIVTLSEGADALASALKTVGRLTAGSAVPETVWNGPLKGFSVRLTSDAAVRLSGVPGLSVHRERSYMPLDEAEDIVDSQFYAGIFDSVNYDVDDGYRGEGTAVAVIDSGFDPHNDLWRLSDETAVKLTREDFDKLLPSLEAESPVYFSAKLPFVYDYCGGDANVMNSTAHGTCVAGIIGANGLTDYTVNFSGIAPEAQLMFMKVFTDGTKAEAKESAIISALNDAYLLGADVVNLSIGIVAGNSDGWPLDDAVTEMLARLEEEGVTVVCAAGNSGTIGVGSLYDRYYGITNARADVPDSGTVAAPASIGSALAVGALTSEYKIQDCMTLSDGTHITFSDSCAVYLEPVGVGFRARFDGRTLEYVPITGVGTAGDFAEAGDLTGKLALVLRGELKFVEKINNASDRGAVGVIVYNNDPEQANSEVTMELAGAKLPAVLVSAADGARMLSLADKRLTIKNGEYAYIASPKGSVPLPTTSWGVTPEMKLKPDVSATGDSVYSTSVDQEYALISGTSISAAFVTGAMAKLKQYALKNGLDSTPARLRIMLMNAAVPTSDRSGAEYSPRAQGAGGIVWEKIYPSGLLMYTSDGAKIELGDGLTAKLDLRFTLENLTDEEITAVLSASVGSDRLIPSGLDGLTETFVSGAPEVFRDVKITLDGKSAELNRHSEDFAGDKVTVPAGGTREVAISVYLSRTELRERAALQTEGFFIEGYIRAEHGGAVCSIPYIGFYGDWAKVSTLDASLYDAESEPFYDGVYLYTKITREFMPASYILGRNILDTKGGYDASKLAFSPGVDSEANELHMNLDLLRTTFFAEYTVTNAAGETVYSDSTDVPLRKNVSQDDTLSGHTMQLWDGRAEDNPNYIYPDGQYYVTMTVTPQGGPDSPDSVTFPVYLDTQAPKLESYDFEPSEEGGSLTVTVSDNHMLQYLYIYSESADFRVNADELTPEKREGRVYYTYTVELNAEETADTLYLRSVDYAFNTKTELLELAL